MKYVTTIERMAKEEQKQAIALKMRQKNIDVETIAEVTGLTIEQVQQLQVANS